MAVERERDEEQRGQSVLQRRAVKESGPIAAPSIVREVLRSPGRPLDAETRAFMEPRLGHDFSQVRVHTDARAAESSRAVNALAYTVGRDVVFGDRQYGPRSSRGLDLIAHELTHVMQQQADATVLQTNPMIGPTDDRYEREADRVGESTVAEDASSQIRVTSVSPRLQRACGPAAMVSVGGCIGVGGLDITDLGLSSESLYRFEVGCDEFRPGEETRLRDYATSISPDKVVEIHGFASEEGDPTFNENLSCARAYAAANVLAEEGVSAATLLEHGATQGPREDRRSVVLTFRPTPSSPETEREPEATPYDQGLVTLCDRDFAGKAGDYVPARHCFVWYRPPGQTTTPSVIPPEETSTYDNAVSGTPDPEPNKTGTVCRATFNIDPECVRDKYRELCSPAEYNLATNNCCTCAYEALSACGANLSRSDFPPENHGTGLPDSLGSGWKKSALEALNDFYQGGQEMARQYVEAQESCIESCRDLPWYSRGSCMQGCVGGPYF